MIYLDNASTTWPKPPSVAAAMIRFIEEVGANPGRASHRLALAASNMLREVRRQIAEMFDTGHPERTILCMNATDALNLAIKGVVRPGDHVITTQLEHNSVSRPLQALAQAGVIEVTWVPVDGQGYVDPEAVTRSYRPRTRLVVINHASNVTGLIQPVEAVGRFVRERGGLLLLDAAQTAGVVDISMPRLGVDLLALPGHKGLLGPMGTGFLCVGPRADVRPWREGGTGGDSSTPTQPEAYPYRLEAGTPNAVGFAGVNAALEVVAPAAALVHERRLLRRLLEHLADLPGVRVLGDPNPDRRVGTLSFTVPWMRPDELGSLLNESFGIAVRTGLHCAPLIHRALGTFPDGAIRVSPGPYSTEDDIDKLADALRQMAAG